MCCCLHTPGSQPEATCARGGPESRAGAGGRLRLRGRAREGVAAARQRPVVVQVHLARCVVQRHRDVRPHIERERGPAAAAKARERGGSRSSGCGAVARSEARGGWRRRARLKAVDTPAESVKLTAAAALNESALLFWEDALRVNTCWLELLEVICTHVSTLSGLTTGA